MQKKDRNPLENQSSLLCDKSVIQFAFEQKSKFFFANILGTD